jgi:hypothetical protein
MERLSVGPELSISQLAERLDRAGMVRLDDLLPTDWLENARTSVQRYISEIGDHDFFLVGPDDEGSEPVRRLIGDSDVPALMKELSAFRYPRSADTRLESCLRVLTGPARQGATMLPLVLHYDASVATIVVPIVIPDGEPGQSGELVAFTNHRPFRRYIAMHIVDKLKTHNSWYRARAVRQVHAEPEKYVVDLQPGSAYLFWGYRTYHGNMPCAPGQLRATLILQYGDPHRDSPVLNLMRQRRARRMRRWGRRHTVRSAPPLDETAGAPSGSSHRRFPAG